MGRRQPTALARRTARVAIDEALARDIDDNDVVLGIDSLSEDSTIDPEGCNDGDGAIDGGAADGRPARLERGAMAAPSGVTRSPAMLSLSKSMLLSFR